MAAVVGVAALQRADARRAPRTSTVEVGDCAGLASPDARLACFDAQVEAARRARPASDSAARQPPPARPRLPPRLRAEPARTDRAGPRLERARGESHAERAAAGRVSWPRVAELRETVPNSYVITLDNGQVWRQTRPLAYPLREGHEVRIYTTGMFGYRLTNRELRGFIAVERVR